MDSQGDAMSLGIEAFHLLRRWRHIILVVMSFTDDGWPGSARLGTRCRRSRRRGRADLAPSRSPLGPWRERGGVGPLVAKRRGDDHNSRLETLPSRHPNRR